jgi:hypothetical protein
VAVCQHGGVDRAGGYVMMVDLLVGLAIWDSEQSGFCAAEFTRSVQIS